VSDRPVMISSLRTGLVALAIAVAFLAGAWTAVVVLVAESPSLTSATAPVADLAAHGDPRLRLTCDADPQACDLARRTIVAFPYPWLTVGYDVHVTGGDDLWLSGLADPGSRTITLFVREDTTEQTLAATFAHEVGHALHQICEDEVLDVWRDRRGIPFSVPLFVDPPHDYDSVAEDFAEAFREYLGFGTSMSTVGQPLGATWLQRNADIFVPWACPER
jgi:hypothetical protein